MRLLAFKQNGNPTFGIVDHTNVIPISSINVKLYTEFGQTLDEVFQANQFDDLVQIEHRILENNSVERIPINTLELDAILRSPSKIWGIGLNYQEHAVDLSEHVPKDFPGSFMKGAQTIIGPNETIKLPLLSERTTGEAELGLVVRETSTIIPEEDFKEHLFGYIAIIDMTAEDILRKNPRFLTLSKNFDSFLVIGPELVTPDEIQDLEHLKVQTIVNGEVKAWNEVKQMTYSPPFLLNFHSQVMSFQAGDIISTGTPGAHPLSHDDQITCKINGEDFEFHQITVSVIDLKQ